MVTAMSATLEQRIATVLSAQDVTSDVVALLITEVETAIVAADKAAEAEREKALDLLASPDAAKARASMEDAAFTRDRLRTVLPQLKEVRAQGYLKQWRADYEALRVDRDALAAELRDIYPVFATKIPDLFTRIAANNAARSRLHQARPAGCALHLAEAELVARDIECFSTANPSIAETLQLPDFEHSAQLAWPPPKPSMAVQVATSMTYGYSGGNWWQESNERVQAMREEHARVIGHYDAMARAREEREAAEARAVQERRAAE